MAKYFKRYNKQSKKWELVSSPDVTIIHELDGGTKISDTDVVVTNYNYAEEGEETTTLDEALSTISDDISRLQRNVSWLGEHGGGGGGGGGGGYNPTLYGIEIISPIIENNAVYINTTSFSVRFKITGGTSADQYRYRYIFDGTDISDYTTINNEEDKTITIRDINSVTQSTTHSFQIEAITPADTTVRQSFRIYENTLKLSLSSQNNIANGEVIMTMTGNGAVYFNVKNGIINSNTTLHFSCNGVEDDVSYTNDTTSDSVRTINIWQKIIDRSQVEANDLYVVTIYAQATYGTTVNTTTDPIVFGVRIRNAEQMAIFFDGLTYDDDPEPTSVELNGRLKFNFRVYLPILITDTNIYYAIKLISPLGDETIVAGSSFDDSLYNTNIPDEAQKYISVSLPMASYYVQEGWKLTVKAWSGRDKTINLERTGIFDIKETNTDMFPRQHYKRYVGYGTASADTCIFAWDSYSVMRDDTWTSSIREYMPAYGGEMTPIQTVAQIKTYNTNGKSSGFITSEAVPYMRLQNEAYAIADMSNYATEIAFMTNNENHEGFDISITVNADDLADDTKTVFLWGTNDGNGNLSNGIKISLSEAVWYVRGTGGRTATLRANLRQGKRNTIDFVYDDSKVYIYVDGVINDADNIGQINQSSDYQFPTKAYFAADLVNDTLTNFSDIKVYEFAVYTKALNPLQIAVNGKNARLEGPISDENVLNDYREWKSRNLIYNYDDAKNKALSYLVSSEGKLDYDSASFAQLQEASPIPIILINANGTDFTREYFHTDYSGDDSVTKIGRRCVVQYFTKSGSISFNAEIRLQGTSTLSYYIKNLEMIIADTCSEDSHKTKLLQVREDWFPEKQYTLKADVVDSAHANNAMIGYWVNHHCGLMEDNPAMEGFTDQWRPKDVNANGAEPLKHADTREATYGNEIDFDEKVQIKHTLEGFPVLMLIKFADSNNFELIGIYSFNLGRYSYFNMGMKFLKEFSRRSENNPKGTIPALIDHYVEYGKNEPFGDHGIITNNVYSYEFGATADDNNIEHQTWTQDDVEIMKFYGKFRFYGPGEEEDINAPDGAEIWTKLSNLFGITATMGTATGLGSIGFEGKQRFTSDGDKLIPRGGNRYTLTDNGMETFNDHMSITNAVGYFVVASALGMTDSLGKNLTLRTWDGGNKWWTCFYDMDTALGLTNEGDDGVIETAYIDSYYNELDPVTNISKLSVTLHDPASKYGAYGSKLWAIFRDGRFTEINNGGKSYYNSAWTFLRKIGGALETYAKFISLMEEKVGGCGELIYNYDYESKYIGPGQNMLMLHGTRIEYVRNWLKKRLYFLDGVFEDSNASAGMFSDSPFYVNKVNVTNRGRANYIPYRITTTTPTFIKINTGNIEGGTETSGKYFIPAHTEIEIHTIEHTSTKQTSFSSSNLITQFKGLDGIRVESLNNNQSYNTSEILTALVEFDIHGTKMLQDNPLIFETNRTDKNGLCIYGGESSLESINISDTSFANSSPNNTLSIHLEDYTKIKYIDISNSPVTNFLLPSSVLQRLNVRGSNIDSFFMSNQPVLQTVDFTNCSKITEVNISNCAGLKNISLSSIPNLINVNINACNAIEELNISNNEYLRTLTIANNASLNTLVISNCPALQRIDIIGNSSLANLTISECIYENLAISIVDSPLEDVKLIRLDTTVPVGFPAREYMSGVTRFELRNIVNATGFYYYGESVETYEDTGDYILDMTPMTSLDGENIFVANVNVKYVRFPNDPAHPIVVNSRTFYSSNDIVRIFGHIKLTESVFYGKENFYINHDEAYRWTPNGILTDYSDVEFVDGDLFNTDFSLAHYGLEGTSPLFVDDPDYTNIAPFDEADLTGWFAGTRCDVHDAYYVLSLCNSRTRVLSELFAGCRYISTDKDDFLDINTFAKCKSVTNINGIFRGCKIGGPLFEPLLDPLIDNLTEFRNVFDGTYYVIREKCFFPENCKIVTIEGFNPNVGGEMLYDNQLLVNLPDLEVISNSFNECSIMFDQGSADATELFQNNTKLREILNSFVDIGGSGSIANLFGGYSDNPDQYPNRLQSIVHSFIFNEDCSHDPGLLYPSDPGTGILLPLGNSFFKRIAGTLKYVTGGQPGANASYDDTWKYGTSTSFYGPGLIKFLSNFEPEDPDLASLYPGMDDCDGDVFPYDILKGCVNLVECPDLFEFVHNFKNYDNSEGRESVITIDLLFKNGRSIFEDCVKLKNVSSFFRSMSKSIHCRLAGDAFKNCEIVNADNIFNGIYIVNKIPYHLFYEEGVKEYTVAGLTAAQASALGVSGNEGDLASISDGQYSVYNGTAKYGKNTISRMSYALANLSESTLMSGYSVTNNEFEKVLCEDDQYAPDFEYILNGLHYTRNIHKKRYTFDKYAYDGSTTFLTRLQASPVWSRNDVNFETLPAEFVDTDPSDVMDWQQDRVRDYTGWNNLGSFYTYFQSKNYFCPPDIFKYCVNDVSTNIKGALSSASGPYGNNNGVEVIHGAIGRIPEFLFEPVSEIGSISFMFMGCQTLLPHKWGTSKDNLGVLYPPQLLSHFTNLQEASNLFANTSIWRYTAVPTELFESNGRSLIDISGLWRQARWVESTDEYDQVTVDVFSHCVVLQNVSSLLGDSRGSSIPKITPLFTYSNNRLINNCSGFMSYSTRSTGNVPTFWKDWGSMNGSLSFFAIVEPYSYEAMVAKFPNWEASVPTEYYTNMA